MAPVRLASPRWIAGLALLLVLGACATPGDRDDTRATGNGRGCAVVQRAALPMDLGAGVPQVDGRINGTPVRLLVDTGLSGSSVFPPSLADRLGLVTGGPVEPMLMIDSVVGVRQGLIERLELDKLVLEDVAALVPEHDIYHGIDPIQTIGMGVLGRFDLELDAVEGSLRLHETRHCDTRLKPFAGAFSVLPITYGAVGTPTVPVQVNGRTLQALVDTGADITFLSRAGASVAGLDVAAPASGRLTPDADRDASMLDVWIEVFDEVRIGDLLARDVLLPVVDTQIPHAMVLGMDVLSQRPIWISFSTDALYLRLEPTP